MKNRTKDEIIDSMVDSMPFELNVKIRPYIKEAMDIYLNQELSKLRQHDVSGRSEQLCQHSWVKHPSHPKIGAMLCMKCGNELA